MELPANFNFEAAYRELREVFECSIVAKAFSYATSNPLAVYGEGSEEYSAVLNGYFDLYLSNTRIPSSCERT
jgi:hypothetical protein